MIFFGPDGKLGAPRHLKVSIIPVFQGESDGDGPESSFDV